jgi:hypothetical protein
MEHKLWWQKVTKNTVIGMVLRSHYTSKQNNQQTAKAKPA